MKNIPVKTTSVNRVPASLGMQRINHLFNFKMK